MSRLNLHREFWDGCADVISSASVVLDLGGGTPWSGPVKQQHLSESAYYASVDISLHQEPNVAGDVIVLPFRNGIADLVVSCAVLEHLPSPILAVNEMHRILKKGGNVLGYVPFSYPWHGSPSDFHRFTPEALKTLFADFSGLELVPCGNYSTVTLGYLTGFSLPLMRFLGPLADLMGRAATALAAVSGTRRNVSDSYEKTCIGHYFSALK